MHSRLSVTRLIRMAAIIRLQNELANVSDNVRGIFDGFMNSVLINWVHRGKYMEGTSKMKRFFYYPGSLRADHGKYERNPKED